MKQFGEILLVSCYELGHQPLGVAWPLGFLKSAGYSPDALDLAVGPLDMERVGRAKFIGMCVPMHTALRLGTHAGRRIRATHPEVHICFFGLYAGLNADYLLEDMADSVIGGEYEESLVRLVQAIESGNPGSVEGVSRKGSLKEPYLKHLSFVLPNREPLPPLDRYAKLEDGRGSRVVGTVEASRGCRHLCRHCPIPPVYGGKFFTVARDIVVSDIRGLVTSGATHITFGDPDFLNAPNHSLRVVRSMHELFPEITFDFTAKIEHLLKFRDLLTDLAACGAIFVVAAVESLNDEVLSHLRKGHTRADVFEALELLRGAKIALRPSLVAFTPWTTIDDYLDVLTVVEREGLVDHIDPVQYTVRLLVPPGSTLLDHPPMRPHLGKLNEASFYYEWSHPDPRMDRLHADVARVVEDAARIGEDPFHTFYRLREITEAMRNGRLPTAVAPPPRPSGERPPRLTEPWFCCAEPTGDQLNSLAGS